MGLKFSELAKLLTPALIGLALTACGSAKDETSSGKVTNGIAISGDTFPSTVLLITMGAQGQSICTGTFVNDSQVVTAAHCVQGLSATRPNMLVATEVNGRVRPIARAVNWARNPNYSFAQGVSQHDLAVVNFPANTAPAISPIAEKSPEVGEAFAIVGFGNNKNSVDKQGAPNGTGAGTKRAGINRVSQVRGGMISFTGLTGLVDVEGIEQGQWVSSGSGDSGGPMFVGETLVGVTSGGSNARTPDGLEIAISLYVDLNSASSKAFLATALKKTAPVQESDSGEADVAPVQPAI